MLWRKCHIECSHLHLNSYSCFMYFLLQALIVLMHCVHETRSKYSVGSACDISVFAQQLQRIKQHIFLIHILPWYWASKCHFCTHFILQYLLLLAFMFHFALEENHRYFFLGGGGKWCFSLYSNLRKGSFRIPCNYSHTDVVFSFKAWEHNAAG